MSDTPHVTPEDGIARLKADIEMLRCDAVRVASTTSCSDLERLWRGKAIAYETVLGAMERLKVVAEVSRLAAALAERKVLERRNNALANEHAGLAVIVSTGSEPASSDLVMDALRLLKRAEHAEASLAAQAQEIAALRFKLRLYENGTSPNQPLVDDIERFRREAEQAMRQRDSTQGTNNKLRRDLAAVRQERDALQAAQQWQPIETAPKDGTWVLIACDEVYKARFDRENELWYFDVDGCAIDPTHWQPFPAPPVLSSAEGGQS